MSTSCLPKMKKTESTASVSDYQLTSRAIMYQRNSTLLAKLRTLTLAGQNEEGELEWIGTDRQWRESEIEEMAIVMDKEFQHA